MNDWERYRQVLHIGADALHSRDPELWAKFEDEFAKLPRALGPSEADYDRKDAADRFRTRQHEEPDETLPTPFRHLNDSLLGGFARGDLVIIAGAGKVGKSMLLDQCLESAHGAGANCRLYLSEMSPQKREARWVQRRLGVPMGRVLHKRLPPEEVERVAGEIDSHFPWDATRANGKGFAELAQAIVKHRPDVAAIDVLTKVSYDGQRDLANGVTTLHAAAESVGACLILATHLSRAGIDRETGFRRPPTVDDIMDASAVANFADVVLLLHRTQGRENGKATSHYLPETKLYAPFVRTGESTTLDLVFSGDRLAFSADVETPGEQAVLA